MTDAPIDALKAIAHQTRFAILQALTQGERNVGEIESATGITQPSLSQQLAVLRSAGLVETRRDAKLVYYRLDRVALRDAGHAIEALSGRAGHDPASAPARASWAGRAGVPGAANFARLA